MTPTPPSHSSFTDSFRFRSRRQRHANPYEPTHSATPTQAHTQAAVTPLVDEEDGDGGGIADTDDLSDGGVEDEDVEDDVEADIDEEPNDAEEEEGGIEEGLSFFYTLLHSFLPTSS